MSDPQPPAYPCRDFEGDFGRVVVQRHRRFGQGVRQANALPLRWRFDGVQLPQAGGDVFYRWFCFGYSSSHFLTKKASPRRGAETPGPRDQARLCRGKASSLGFVNSASWVISPGFRVLAAVSATANES